MKKFKATVLSLVLVVSLMSFSILVRGQQSQENNRGKIVIESTGQAHYTTNPDGSSRFWCDNEDDTKCTITFPN